MFCPILPGTRADWVQNLEEFVSDFSPLLSQISVGGPAATQQGIPNILRLPVPIFHVVVNLIFIPTYVLATYLNHMSNTELNLFV